MRMLGITSGEGATAMFTDIDRECQADTDTGNLVAVLNRHHAELANQPGWTATTAPTPPGSAAPPPRTRPDPPFNRRAPTGGLLSTRLRRLHPG
jgi:hypothetical protein